MLEILKTCPTCGSPGIDVKEATVKSLLKAEKAGSMRHKNGWHICANPQCRIAYFTADESFGMDDLRVRIWFKDRTDDVTICYCSKMSKREIMDAVRHGCKTIDQVQAYTGKNVTGNCERENPLGRCCRDVFLWAMREGKKD